MKLAVFLPNWVGDVVMATPMLRALRDRFPAGHITGVMRPYLADLLTGTGLLDDRLLYDPRGKEPNRRGWRLASEMSRRKFDAAVLTTNSLRSAALVWSAGVPIRVGYTRNFRGRLLTHKLTAPMQGRTRIPVSTLDSYLWLAAALGAATPSRRQELATTAADEAAADKAWRNLGLDPAAPTAVFNSSGAYGSAKLWPVESFAALARRTAEDLGWQVLFLCGPSERELARGIVSAAGHKRVVSLADEPPSLGLSKACVRRARLMVTTDSGPRHFAAAFNVPVVTLFGPTHIAWSETYFPLGLHVQHAVDCGPCQRRVCPLGHHRCMKDLGVDRVMAAVRSLAASTERLTRAA